MTEYEYGLELEQRLIEEIGIEELFKNVILALSTDERIDIYHYIARMYDIDFDDIIEKF